MQPEASRPDHILMVAESLFRAKGYHATSMNDVAVACGIQESSLFCHFSAKQELAIAVMAKVQTYFDTSVFSYAHDDSLSPEIRLLKMNNAIVQFFSRELTGCVFGNFAVEKMSTTPIFVGPIQHYFNSWSSAYRAIFSNVYGMNEASSLADDFVSDLQGALIMIRVTGTNEPLLRASARLLQALEAGSKRWP